MMNLLQIVFVSFISFASLQAIVKLKHTDPMPIEIASDSYNRNNTKRVPLRIVTALTYSSFVWSLGPLTSEPLRYALNKAKEDVNFLPNYEIILEPFDDMSNPEIMVHGMLKKIIENDYAENRLPIVINTALDVKPAATFEHFNIVGLAPACINDEPTLNPHLYKSYFSGGAAFIPLYIDFLPRFIAAVGWKRVAIIAQNNNYNDNQVKLFSQNILKLSGDDFQIIGPFQIVFLTGVMPESDHIEQAVLKAKAADARVILIEVFPSSIVACWLHRHGMFGPNYSFLIRAGSIFLSDNNLRYPWCTEAMLAEILPSFFVFENLNANSVGETDVVDDIGSTGQMFEDEMHRRIDHLDSAAIYFYWSTIMYSAGTALAQILNRTETALNVQNQTLSDWFTNGDKFRNNGSDFMELVKAQFYTDQINTQIGTMKWTKGGSKQANYEGMYKVVLQMQRNTSSVTGFSRVPVFALRHEQGEAIEKFYHNNIKWRTADDLPHRDATHFIEKLQNAINHPVAVVLKVVAGISTVCVLIFMAFILCKHGKINRKTLFTLYHCVGNILQLLFTLMIPIGRTPSMAKLCSASLTCLFTGQILSLASTMSRLDFFKMEKKQKVLAIRTRPNNEQNNTSSGGKWPKWLNSSMPIVESVISAILFVIWFELEPISIDEYIFGPIRDENDDSIAVNYVKPVCRATVDFEGSLALIGVIAGLFLLLIFRLVLTILKLKHYESLDFISRGPVRGFGATGKTPSPWSPYINYATGSIVIFLGALLVSGAFFGLLSEPGIITLSIASFLSVVFSLIAMLSELFSSNLVRDDTNNSGQSRPTMSNINFRKSAVSKKTLSHLSLPN